MVQNREFYLRNRKYVWIMEKKEASENDPSP
jgi:hypothetical protein